MAEQTEASEPSGAQRELQLLSHFGIGGQVGRVAELAERGPDAITARPAS
jgi:hypothetical protein